VCCGLHCRANVYQDPYLRVSLRFWNLHGLQPASPTDLCSIEMLGALLWSDSLLSLLWLLLSAVNFCFSASLEWLTWMALVSFFLFCKVVCEDFCQLSPFGCRVSADHLVSVLCCSAVLSHYSSVAWACCFFWFC
jgi:hypothetical protein